MIDIELLKKKMLNLAFTGKLTSHQNGDDSAELIYSQIISYNSKKKEKAILPLYDSYLG